MSFILLDSFTIQAVYGQGFMFTKKQNSSVIGHGTIVYHFRIQDILSVSDSVSSNRALNRYHLDCQILDDVIQKNIIMTRTVVDSLSVSDMSYKGNVINRYIQDTISPQDIL